MHTERHIRLHGAHNVRDLGGYAAGNGATTRWRSFLRADALHELSPADVAALLDLGLRTVIDLRSDIELARQPSTLADRKGIAYHHVPLFDGLAPVDAMLAGDAGFDLSARYVAAIDTCRPAVARVAAVIAEAEDGVVLFNCTAGKDRTGIVAAMLLSLAGVDRRDIAADYALTASLAGPLMERLMLGAVARGLDETTSRRLLSSEPGAMLAFLDHVESRHGGFQAYLGEASIADEALRRIGARLLAPPPPAGA